MIESKISDFPYRLRHGMAYLKRQRERERKTDLSYNEYNTKTNGDFFVSSNIIIKRNQCLLAACFHRSDQIKREIQAKRQGKEKEEKRKS